MTIIEHQPTFREPPRAARRRRGFLLLMAALCVLCLPLVAVEQPLRLESCAIEGSIVGANISFRLDLQVVVAASGSELDLAVGDLALLEHQELPEGCRLRFDRDRHALVARFDRRGEQRLVLEIGLRPQVQGDWREVRFDVPSSLVRELSLRSDRKDLEVDFPGALRQRREVIDGRLLASALQGPGEVFAVRWKPQVAALDAALVFAARSSVVAAVEPGALTLDLVVAYELAQGELDRLRLTVPSGVQVTAVRGAHIRDWRLTGEADARELLVTLNRPQRDHYALQLSAQRALGEFPTGVAVPVIEPIGAMRHSGQVLVGTDSAVRLVVDGASGCTQIDAAGFDPAEFETLGGITPPRLKRFAYQFAASPYRLDLELAEIVPAIDVQQQLRLLVREGDVVLEGELDLEVRDAPVPAIEIGLPPGFVLAAATGEAVEPDAAVTLERGDRRVAVIPFRQPFQGRSLIALRLERASSVLGERLELHAPTVLGARVQRGHLVLDAEPAVVLETPLISGLRQIHTAAVPVAGGGRYAYRFRTAGWSLEVAARRRPAGVRAELFHLHTVDDGVVHGTVVVNYVITGAPVDVLRFRLPAGLSGIEFVGADVVRSERRGEEWTVGLRRRVSGDYNLAIAFTQALGEDEVLQVGGVSSLDAESQSGFAVIAAQRDLQLALPESVPGLLAIEAGELPPHYRLLVPAPILASWSFAAAPPLLSLQVEDRGAGAPLAALIELAEAQTELTVTADERVESHTVVRYQIKNASAQFLPLRLPPGSGTPRAWIIAGDGERRAATVSRVEGGLLVQLPRLANPNQPLGLELGYGAAHGAADEPLELQACQLGLAATFTRWRVQGPADWALLPRDPDAAVSRDGRPGIGAGGVLAAIGRAWLRALQVLPWMAVAVAGLVAVGVAAALPRGSAWPVALGFVAVLALAAGGLAVAQVELGLQQQGELSSLVATSLLQLEGAEAPSLVLDLRERWLVGLDLPLVLSALALIAAASTRRARVLRPVLVLAAVIALALSLPPLWALAAHLATWFAVLVVALSVGWRLRARRWGAGEVRGLGRSLGVAGMLLLALGLVGCGGQRVSSTSERVELDQVHLDLVAEADAMAVRMQLSGTIGRGDHAWLPPAAVLDREHVLPAGCTVVVDAEGRQRLRVAHGGVLELELNYLLPLAAADAEGRRSFTLAVPASLRNAVSLRIGETGQRILAPGAVRLESGEDANVSWAELVVAPGEALAIAWWPRSRATEREDTLAYAELHSLYRADRGVVSGIHRVDYRIAQGELSELVLRLGGGQTVTDVRGPDLGAWRFDPDGRLLVRLGRAARDSYQLQLTTQVAVNGLPGELTLPAPVVEGVVSQRGVAGLAASRAVRIEILGHPPRAGVEDVLRGAEALLGRLEIEPQRLRDAFRVDPDGSGGLRLRLHAVEPELRASGQATVRIGEERLGYSGELTVDVAKAGVFAIELAISGEVDIDLLAAPQVSHWDERRSVDGERLVTVHLRSDTTGRIPLQLALSRPLGDDLGALRVPAVRVIGARKQTGQLAVLPERGLQLRVAARESLSELHPQELGLDVEGALAFRMLAGEWSLDLAIERIRPLIRVDALHLARVAAGSVRHELRLRYGLEHAGTKRLELQLPPGVFGLAVEGPEIARWDRRDDAVVIELSRKWFDRTYPLTLRFETRIDADGTVAIAPVGTPAATIRRDHLAVFATDRVELAVLAADEALLEADARAIPAEFGAGDLAAAAYCYRASGRDYRLAVRATRHAPAALQQAAVRSARIATVLTPRGEQLSQLRLAASIGARRHLRLALPAGSRLWELSVNGRAVDAARDGGGAWLVPVAHTAVDEIEVELIATWVTAGTALGGRQDLLGPELDLPLRDVEWTVVVPEGWQVDDFGGTLHHAEEDLAQTKYDLGIYVAKVAAGNVRSIAKATASIEAGDELAAQGSQYAARQALADAFNYSTVDTALNEDARVQLLSLSKEQALGCLLGRRGSLRRGPVAAPDLGDRFNRADVRRLAAGLAKDDSDNLERITGRLAELSATVGSPPRITVELPQHGRLLRFTTPLQVDPAVPMRVAFDAAREPDAEQRGALLPLLGLLAALLAATALPLWLTRLLPPPVRRGSEPESSEDDVGELLDGLDPIVDSSQAGEQTDAGEQAGPEAGDDDAGERDGGA